MLDNIISNCYGYEDIRDGNETAYEYAAIGSCLDETMTCNEVQTPLIVVTDKINDREITT